MKAAKVRAWLAKSRASVMASCRGDNCRVSAAWIDRNGKIRAESYEAEDLADAVRLMQHDVDASQMKEKP